MRYRLLEQLPLIDASAHQVEADSERALAGSVAHLKSWVFWSVDACVSPIIKQDRVEQTAYAQVNLDEMSIACQLERYHWAHSAYPLSLQALAGRPLSHDVMTGDPYHYSLRPDGSYLLYSVGWNGEDDHGGDLPAGGTNLMDAPDWIWPSRYESPR